MALPSAETARSAAFESGVQKWLRHGGRPPEPPLKNPVDGPFWRLQISAWLVRLAAWVAPKAPEVLLASHQDGKRGQRMIFTRVPGLHGYPAFKVRSVRGSMDFGMIEWSTLWRQPKYVPSPHCTYDPASLAEIFAMMKEVRP